MYNVLSHASKYYKPSAVFTKKFAPIFTSKKLILICRSSILPAFLSTTLFPLFDLLLRFFGHVIYTGN